MSRALTHAAGGPRLAPAGTAPTPHLLTHSHTHRGVCNHSRPVDTGEAGDQASSKSREETQRQGHLGRSARVQQLREKRPGFFYA